MPYKCTCRQQVVHVASFHLRRSSQCTAAWTYLVMRPFRQQLLTHSSRCFHKIAALAPHSEILTCQSESSTKSSKALDLQNSSIGSDSTWNMASHVSVADRALTMSGLARRNSSSISLILSGAFSKKSASFLGDASLSIEGGHAAVNLASAKGLPCSSSQQCVKHLTKTLKAW